MFGRFYPSKIFSNFISSLSLYISAFLNLIKTCLLYIICFWNFQHVNGNKTFYNNTRKHETKNKKLKTTTLKLRRNSSNDDDKRHQHTIVTLDSLSTHAALYLCDATMYLNCLLDYLGHFVTVQSDAWKSA